MIADEYLLNLDGSWPDDLRAYADCLQKKIVQPGDERVRELLVEYARTKAVAMEERAAGNIPIAKGLESQCETLYRQLPKYAQW